MKIVKWLLILITLIFLTPILSCTFIYEYELNQIKSELNNIEGVSVIDIWGHEDVTLENIGARIKVDGKGELELLNLSSDANDYPNTVIISKIGDYSFSSFSCFDYKGMGYHKGLGYAIDISENSVIGKLIGVKFENPKMVIENYDNILKAVESLNKVPQWNYYKNENEEEYILVYKDKNEIKSLFKQYGVDNYADFQHILSFENPDCQ